jgi:hypothetical protein
MSKKEKIQIVPILSREALEVAVAEVATLRIQAAAAKADMELEIARVQERHHEQGAGVGPHYLHYYSSTEGSEKNGFSLVTAGS